MRWHQMHQQQLAVTLLLQLFILLQQVSAAALRDIVMPLPAGYYNPSLVIYEGSGWLVSRSTELKWDTTGLKWILNRAYLCQVNVTDWSLIGCHDFDPWRGDYGPQCRWGSEKWKVPWEAAGVDDTKLFTWPGRGLWAITGRRPQQPVDSIYCQQPVVWQQWLVQLAPEGQQVEPKLFDYPPVDPVGVAWGKSQASQGPPAVPALAAPPIEANVGKRKLHRWFPLSPAAYVPTSADSSGLSTGSSNQDANSWPPNTRPRRRRRRHRHSAAGTVIGSVVGGDSLVPESSGVAHHYKEHKRPRLQAAAAAPTIQQSRQQQHELGPAAPEIEHLQRSPNSSEAPASGKPPTSRQHTASSATPAAVVKQDHLTNTVAMLEPPNDPAEAGDGRVVTNKTSVGTGHAGGGKSTRDSMPATWEAYQRRAPVGLVISDAKAVYGHEHSITEKNWMPFVWEGNLYMTYKLVPTHKVYQLHPNGIAVPAHETDTGGVLSGLGTAAARLHGGPPLVYVEYPKYSTMLQDPGLQAATINQKPYYLGVAHYWLPVGQGDGRTYHHFLIKMEDRPPFRFLQVSAELPVQYNKHYKRVAFVSGIDIALLPAGTGPAIDASSSGKATRDVLIAKRPSTRATLQQQASPQQQLPHILVSYGSGDWESHVAVMTLDEVEQLFMQGPTSSGEAADSSSVSGVSITSTSFPVAGGQGHYTLLRREMVAEDRISALQQQAPAAVTNRSPNGDVGEVEEHAGLDHRFLYDLNTTIEAASAKSAVQGSLKAAAAEVAAAEATIQTTDGALAMAASGGVTPATDAGDVQYDWE